MINFSKLALELANRFRPILLRVLPNSFLSSVKSKIVQRSTDNLDSISIPRFTPHKYRTGINLIGNIRGDNGLGQSTRLVADILSNTNYEFAIYNYYVPPGTSMNNHSYDNKIKESLDYNVNIIHVNASEFTVSYLQMGKDVWNYRYNIAFWLWELEEFPDEWVKCINLVDEIWTPSEFISKTLRKITNKPVNTIPYCVTAPHDIKMDREYFNLPKDRFLFLMMFDSGSIMERKNPIGTIEAFKQAFDRDNQNVGIVIKINRAEQKDLETIYSILGGYTNIYIVSNTLSKVEINSLVKCVDVYVSLHRAEGFGLVIAEAMLLETPVIATNWSANTEFMNKKVACMVDYQMTEIKEDIPPFKKGYHWADPDIIQASQYMKKLYEDSEFYVKISKEAKHYIEEKLTMQNSVNLVRSRISQIISLGGKK